MIIKDFDCNKCSGVCCINPPELRTIQDLKTAINLNAEILMIVDNNIVLGAGIKSKNNTCPFLKEGKCSIYENRFESCKSFHCLSKSKKQLNLSSNNGWQELITPEKAISIKEKVIIADNSYIGQSFDVIIDNYFQSYNNYKIVNIDEYIHINLITNMEVISDFIKKIKIKETKMNLQEKTICPYCKNVSTLFRWIGLGEEICYCSECEKSIENTELYQDFFMPYLKFKKQLLANWGNDDLIILILFIQKANNISELALSQINGIREHFRLIIKYFSFDLETEKIIDTIYEIKDYKKDKIKELLFKIDFAPVNDLNNIQKFALLGDNND